MENKGTVYFFTGLSGAGKTGMLRHLEDIFTACSRYESAFWDMAWEERD